MLNLRPLATLGLALLVSGLVTFGYLQLPAAAQGVIPDSFSLAVRSD